MEKLLDGREPYCLALNFERVTFSPSHNLKEIDASIINSQMVNTKSIINLLLRYYYVVPQSKYSTKERMYSKGDKKQSKIICLLCGRFVFNDGVREREPFNVIVGQSREEEEDKKRKERETLFVGLIGFPRAPSFIHLSNSIHSIYSIHSFTICWRHGREARACNQTHARRCSRLVFAGGNACHEQTGTCHQAWRVPLASRC